MLSNAPEAVSDYYDVFEVPVVREHVQVTDVHVGVLCVYAFFLC